MKMQQKLEYKIQQWLSEPQFLFLGKLIATFPEGEVYLVGGAVRDAVLGRDTKDFDFIVREIAIDALEKFLATHGQVDLVGKSFGVFKFTPHGYTGEAIDIALPRTEHALTGTGGYKDFAIQSDPNLPIERDLERRDFTMNAIAVKIQNAECRMQNGTVVDPHGGLKDIEQQLIRTVGRPEDRFKEDSLRILRAIRFACQLALSIEHEAWSTICAMMKRVNAVRDDGTRIVPLETIGRELVKAFYADPVQALDLLDACGGIQETMPELLPMKHCPQPPNWHTEGDVWVHSRLALAKLFAPEFQQEFPGVRPDAEVILGTLFHDLGKPYTIKTPEKDGTDRIRFSEHDNIGAEKARAICERLRFAQFPADSPLHVDAQHIEWLVAKHLLPIKKKLEQMKVSTIEKYFMNSRVPGQKLLQVAYADGAATIHEGGKPDLENHFFVKARLQELFAQVRLTKKLPAPLVNGDDIMAAFGLKPGKQIADLLALARDAQLEGKVKTKEDALALLRKALNIDH
ncbi:CCA tRNA nucleotidyltransferase [Candidatus Uhrbacteria bacterium]|nr:CCA tRNA nucleotidyltransferase [Candidatus Uhrbacteria bacterium]